MQKWQKWMILAVSFAFVAFVPLSANAQSSDIAVKKIRALIVEIAAESFPELDLSTIAVKSFESNSTYFQARFSVGRFLTFREIRSTIFVNPLVFERSAPEAGIRAILAHELAHVLFYRQQNRLSLIKLASLIHGGVNARFERRTDLIAIERGYGPGLIEYREWLYQNVPASKIAEKRRDYFSADEIRLILTASATDSKLVRGLKQKVPQNIRELQERIEKTP